MTAWRYEISLLMLEKYFSRSLRSLVKYFSTLKEKFRISARPCNILYIFNLLEISATNLSKENETFLCEHCYLFCFKGPQYC